MQVVHQGAQNQSRTGRPASVVSSMSSPPISGAENFSASGASAGTTAEPASLGSLVAGVSAAAAGGGGVELAAEESASDAEPASDGPLSDGVLSDGDALGDVADGAVDGALVSGAPVSSVPEPHAARTSPAARTGSRRRITAAR